MMENVQAMQGISFSQQVAANNVANMNTNGFHSSRVEFESGPNGQGVRVQDVYENTAAGPLVWKYMAWPVRSFMVALKSAIKASWLIS